MHWVENNGLRYAQFAQLQALPGVWHGIFTRHRREQGSNGALSAFNIGINDGDAHGAVHANRRRMLAVAGGQRAVFARQVHGHQVAVWDRSASRAHSAHRHEVVHLEGDALVTDQFDVALAIQTADCQSVLLADPQRHVIANVHSGWRGSVADIIGRTVDTMVSRFGCRPEDFVAGIGPSLGPCCAEFINYRSEIPQCYWPYRRPGDHFDFWQLSVDQLSRAGVPDRQTAASDICTKCNTSLFFSHRGEPGGTGRFASVIVMRKSIKSSS